MKAKTKPVTTRLPFTDKPIPKKISLPIQDKSAVQLLEDIIDVLGNRKELLVAIIKKFPQAHDGHKTFLQYQQQTKKFIASLLDELSLYGDGIGGPDPHNEYNDYWKAGLQKWNVISQARLIHFWLNLETILKDYYRLLLAQKNILPPSFSILLEEQLVQLEKGKRAGKR